MAFRETLDDDKYVAKLLAEDAKKSSLRYAQQGLSALLPRRPIGSAPKPNTRFLKAIVREADSHNAALEKREELEARVRQRELNERRSRDTGRDIRDRERPRKRRRHSDERPGREERHSREHRSHGRFDVSSDRSSSREQQRERISRDHDGERVESRNKTGQPPPRQRQRLTSETRYSERRVRSRVTQRDGGEGKDYKRQRYGSQLASSDDSREQQKSNRASRDLASHRHSATREGPHSELERLSADDASDSDPLETLVGPLKRPKVKSSPSETAPIRSKGRGAYRPSGAAMDSHFSSDYNPGLDLHPDSELEDEKQDWDMALEALRDREMFKQKHAERLREAGFDDADIKNWEDSGKEKDVTDVKWTARGEAREWDLGKEDQG